MAIASDDEGFALSVTSKLKEFTALGYPSHVLNGAIGRTFARTKDERLLRARICSFALVKARRAKKDKAARCGWLCACLVVCGGRATRPTGSSAAQGASMPMRAACEASKTHLSMSLVGEPSKGGCSRPRDMICRQHEFVMGHHRDPTVRYLAIALLTYRRLRPSSRCSQNSVNTGERIFRRRFLLRRNVQNTQCH